MAATPGRRSPSEAPEPHSRGPIRTWTGPSGYSFAALGMRQKASTVPRCSLDLRAVGEEGYPTRCSRTRRRRGPSFRARPRGTRGSGSSWSSSRPRSPRPWCSRPSSPAVRARMRSTPMRPPPRSPRRSGPRSAARQGSPPSWPPTGRRGHPGQARHQAAARPAPGARRRRLADQGLGPPGHARGRRPRRPPRLCPAGRAATRRQRRHPRRRPRDHGRHADRDRRPGRPPGRRGRPGPGRPRQGRLGPRLDLARGGRGGGHGRGRTRRGRGAARREGRPDRPGRRLARARQRHRPVPGDRDGHRQSCSRRAAGRLPGLVARRPDAGRHDHRHRASHCRSCSPSRRSSAWSGISGAYMALRPAGRLASTSDELQRKYAEVAEQAYIDVMTGLGNQRAFQIECDRHLDLVRRGRLPLTLVILDLDDFKRINDTDGHKIGDELLAAFARIIEGCIRRSDRAFRIGRRRVRDPHARNERRRRRDRHPPPARQRPRAAGRERRRPPGDLVLGRHRRGDGTDRPGRALLAGRRRDVLVEAPRADGRSRSSTRTSTRCRAG